MISVANLHGLGPIHNSGLGVGCSNAVTNLHGLGPIHNSQQDDSDLGIVANLHGLGPIHNLTDRTGNFFKLRIYMVWDQFTTKC